MSMSMYHQKLREIAAGLRPEDIGHQGGVYTGFTTIDVRAMEEFVVRIGVAQAIADGLSPAADPGGLAVRDILPDKDFLDVNAAVISKREWRLPWSGTYGNVEAEVQVYQTSRSSDNDRKIFVFYGARLTGIFGPGRVGTETGGNVGSATNGALGISAIIFKRGNNIRLIDIWQIEQMGSTIEGICFARSPIVYKKNDSVRIDVYPKTGASGTADNIMLLGKVVEPLGNTVNG